LLLGRGRHDPSVDRGKTQDDDLPGVTGNLFENDVEPVSKGNGSCERDHVHPGKWRCSGGKSLPL
jgi:stalled ribosome alternative rescue factor ArfA